MKKNKENGPNRRICNRYFDLSLRSCLPSCDDRLSQAEMKFLIKKVCMSFWIHQYQKLVLQIGPNSVRLSGELIIRFLFFLVSNQPVMWTEITKPYFQKRMEPNIGQKWSKSQDIFFSSNHQIFLALHIMIHQSVMVVTTQKTFLLFSPPFYSNRPLKKLRGER